MYYPWNIKSIVRDSTLRKVSSSFGELNMNKKTQPSTPWTMIGEDQCDESEGKARHQRQLLLDLEPTTSHSLRERHHHDRRVTSHRENHCESKRNDNRTDELHHQDEASLLKVMRSHKMCVGQNPTPWHPPRSSNNYSKPSKVYKKAKRSSKFRCRISRQNINRPKGLTKQRIVQPSCLCHFRPSKLETKTPSSH